MTNNLLSRRSLLTGLLVSPLAALLITRESHGQTPPPSGPFTLAPLPYAPSALEPHIDAQTMTIHHDRHHQTYVNNLNAAVGKYPALAKSTSAVALLKNLDRLPEDIRTAVRNNAGGHVNHTMFWETMTPGGAKMPAGSLARKISDTFGSFEKFQAAFEDAGAKRFGSGWVWLVDNKGKLEVVSTPNQDHPILDGKKALLGNDVWEHAYYLKYQNKRADYLKAWWNVVNWDIVADRM